MVLADAHFLHGSELDLSHGGEVGGLHVRRTALGEPSAFPDLRRGLDERMPTAVAAAAVEQVGQRGPVVERAEVARFEELSGEMLAERALNAVHRADVRPPQDLAVRVRVLRNLGCDESVNDGRLRQDLAARSGDGDAGAPDSRFAKVCRRRQRAGIV